MTQVNEEQLFEAIQSFDQEEAKELFDRLLPIIDEVTDAENSTLLHVSANYNNHEIVGYFLEQYDLKIQTEPTIYTFQKKKRWLNRKDNQGFTCIHYAVFRANSHLAFLLQQHGADIYAINKQGLTVLHIAAQGDSPVLMYYYLHKGMKISTEDAKGSTALHWACYSGQENAAYALIAWGAELDKQDFTYGMTPLHLAVMSGNGRIVKKLLVKGCDRNIKNYNNRLPLDIARQNEYKNITEMIMDKRGIEQFFNIKTPYRSIGKYTFPYFFLIGVFLVNFILNVSFVLFRHFPHGGDLAFIYLVAGFMVILFFIMASKKKPGYICVQSSQNDFQILKKNNASKICFQCMLVKPERSRHCQICRRCVSVYDHHCPWVANCVGSHNYFWFYVFIFSIEFFMIFTIVFECINISQMDWEDHSALEIIRIICICLGLASSLAFLLPLTYLLYVQTYNCMTNQTTFQRFGHTRQKTASVSNPTTQKSQSLREQLLVRDSTMRNTSMGKLDQRSRSMTAEIESNPCGNCYEMCFKNADNLAYQVGKVS